MGWGGSWEGVSGWGIDVNPWLIHVNVWQKPLQYCEIISLQLIKINEKKFFLNIRAEPNNPLKVFLDLESKILFWTSQDAQYNDKQMFKV